MTEPINSADAKSRAADFNVKAQRGMMGNRWSIWIDVEGFSNLYKLISDRAIQHLNYLMESLYKIGIHVFGKSPDRLFIHQFGDGFIIVSDFPEKNPTRPLAICIAVMRHLLKKGVITKAAVSAGNFADISSCYPEEVIKAAEDRRHVKIGEGVMTIIPVMGMALIAAHKVSGTDSGALLLLDTSCFSGIPEEVIYKAGTASTIDWVHTELSDVESICNKASLNNLSSEEAEKLIKTYIDQNTNSLSRNWIERTKETLSLK